MLIQLVFFFFFFNDTATTEIYTLSLHDALPIFDSTGWRFHWMKRWRRLRRNREQASIRRRSEEHTSELQSRSDLVCRLLLEKKKDIINHAHNVSNNIYFVYQMLLQPVLYVITQQ